MKHAWVIGAAGDAIAARLPAALTDGDWSVRTIEPRHLADLRVTLSAEHCVIEGEPVDAVVFRSASNAEFSASYAEADRPFADAEMRATWLAVTTLPAVITFNRPDAVSWFETEHWSVWRRELARSGVRLAPCTFGHATSAQARTWVPFSAAVALPDPGDVVARATGSARFIAQPFARTLVACGVVLSGPAEDNVLHAVRTLAARGVSLACIMTDEHGDVAWVDTALRHLAPDEADLVAAAIAHRLLTLVAVPA